MKLFFVFFACLLSLANHAESVDLTSLKLYRTYYFVRETGEQSHRFNVWVKDRLGWKEYEVGLNTADEIPYLTLENFRVRQVFQRGFHLPPQQLNCPEELKPFQAALARRAKKLFKKSWLSISAQVKVAYKSAARELEVHEVIPQHPKQEKGFITTSSARVSITDDDILYVDGTQMIGGVRSIVDTNFEQPDFHLLNFSLPPTIEGSSLLDLPKQHSIPDPIHHQAHENLLQSLKEFKVAPTQQERLLSDLLQRQGDEVVPLGIEQQFELPIYWFDTMDRRSHVIRIKMKTSDLLTFVNSTTIVEPYGLTFQVIGSLPDLKLKIYDRDQYQVELNLNAQDFQVVRSSAGDPVILGYVRFQNYDKLKIPFFEKNYEGQYHLVRIQFDRHLYPSPLVGPNQSKGCDEVL